MLLLTLSSQISIGNFYQDPDGSFHDTWLTVDTDLEVKCCQLKTNTGVEGSYLTHRRKLQDHVKHTRFLFVKAY